MVDKNTAVVCCLLATSAIMLSEKKKRKRKLWIKKSYLKKNISYLKKNISAEWIARNGSGRVPWDNAIVVSAGTLRKLWGSLSELLSSLCERRLERTVLRPELLPVKTAQFSQFFPSGMTSHNKIAQFKWECIGLFAFGNRTLWSPATSYLPVSISVSWSLFVRILLIFHLSNTELSHTWPVRGCVPDIRWYTAANWAVKVRHNQ